MNMIERIAHTKDVFDFKLASDDLKLEVYTLTLNEIFIALGKDLQGLPKNYVDDLKDGLQETINGFYQLRTKPIVNTININAIMPKFIEANTKLLSATTLLDAGKIKSDKYYKSLQICRERIFEILELLA
jgi:hypothetical protein